MERESGQRDYRSAEAGNIEGEYNAWLRAIAPQVFTHPFEWFHREFLDWYWPLLKARIAGKDIPEDMPRAGLLCLGRGLGKSALFEAIALAEGAHFGRSFGVYVSSTVEKASEHLQTVRALIESSEVARYYPGLAQPRVGKFGNQRGWRAEALFTDSGFTLIAASLEQGVRGLRDLELRPTFIQLDDIDERDDSPLIKEEKFNAITKDVIPMLAPFGMVFFAQNLIYSGSIMDDTINRKLDWFHLRHQVGPVNTFQDDFEWDKIDGRPVILAGTPNWSRIDRAVGQDMLNKAGIESFLVECQNNTAPNPEKLVWTGFDERLHVITWDEFKAVVGQDRIPADFELHAGYDAGATGPAKHPGVFTVGAVAPERSPLRHSVFLFCEVVAEALEDENDMARFLIEDLALLCSHLEIKEASRLVKASYQARSEEEAWEMRYAAGSMIPFASFRGSHEAKSERRTFAQKWGLPVVAGDAAKTAGLSQLRFYLKPERRPHPFKADIFGKPTIFLVVANSQKRVAVDKYGLQRLRWEAANLKWDPNITVRDVPTKFGDDATDTVKHILSAFKLGAPLTEHEQQEIALPPGLRREHLDTVPPSFNRDFKEMIRDYRIAEHKKQQGNDHWSSDVMSAKDDVWRNGYGE